MDYLAVLGLCGKIYNNIENLDIGFLDTRFVYEEVHPH